MYQLLKAIADAQTPTAWSFIYARKDFANLHDELETGVPYIFLDPVSKESVFDDANVETDVTYSGTFMVLVSSDIDKGDYNQRYIDQIKPLIVGALATIKSELKCVGSIDFNSWREVEIINVFDYNLDGIVVTYNLTERV